FAASAAGRGGAVSPISALSAAVSACISASVAAGGALPAETGPLPASGTTGATPSARKVSLIPSGASGNSGNAIVFKEESLLPGAAIAGVSARGSAAGLSAASKALVIPALMSASGLKPASMIALFASLSASALIS